MQQGDLVGGAIKLRPEASITGNPATCVGKGDARQGDGVQDAGLDVDRPLLG